MDFQRMRRLYYLVNPRDTVANSSRSISQAPSSAYVHEPLSIDSSVPQIRLVRLLPASNLDEPICCELIRCSLDESLVYETVSYVWGHPETTVPIQISGCTHHVTTNLALGLRYLRLQQERRMLWIDALCINQRDSAEKSVQVASMGRIYTQALRTLVWLGEESTARIAIDFCHGLEDTPLLKEGDDPGQRSYFIDNQHAVTACEELFYGRPYWQRLWVVQELCLGSSVLFHIGATQILFEDFYPLWHNYQRHRSHWALSRTNSDQIDLPRLRFTYPRDLFLYGIHHYRTRHRDRSDQEYPTLSALLEQFKNQEVTDPRDRVFGLLGLSFTDWQGRLAPDYNMPLRGVYISTARAITDVEGLNILFMVEATGRKINNKHLPSWVPDLATKQTPHMLMWKPYVSRFTDIIGTKTLKRMVDGGKSATKDEIDVLFILGMFVATITAVIVKGAQSKNGPIYLIKYDQHLDTRTPTNSSTPLPESKPENEITPYNTSWGPCESGVGDIIVLAQDCAFPLVLRQYGEDFHFVGACILIDAPLQPDPEIPDAFDIAGPGFSDIMRGSLTAEIGKTRHLEIFNIH